VTCLFLLPLCFLIQNAPAQIQQAWVARYNNGILNGTNQAVKLALDSAGNIFVLGFSQNSKSNLGYVTIKYAPTGAQLWAARYDDTNYPTATPSALALDTSNNAIVTGSALTIKYDTNGSQLWSAPYGGSALTVDSSGNVAVTGFDAMFGTVKLTPSGTNLWMEEYPSSCGAAMGQSIVADTNGNFYVAGSYPFYCERGLNDYELLVLKYSGSGTVIWAGTYQEAGSSVQVEGATLDMAANLYLMVDFINYNRFVGFMYSGSGDIEWVSYLTGTSASLCHGIALDRNRRLIVTGQLNYSYNPGQSDYSYYYGTFELETNGNPIWTNFFPQPPIGSSVANSIGLDSANNSYVTGYSPGANGTNDIVTIKYDPNGNMIWLQRYSSPGGGNAVGNAIAVDSTGNVYVTGYDTTAQGGTEIVTIKYSPVTLQRQANGTVILQAQGSPGEAFDIEASTNLLDWLDLGTVQADTNGLLQFDDTNAPAFPARFYYTTPR
jgi:outer membrane protein assembly factor BamB